MNNISINNQSLILPPASKPTPFVHTGQVIEATHNLIVLVTSLEADLAALARRVWQLASASSAHIIFLGLYGNSAQQPGLRRELVTMAAMVSDGAVSAEVAVLQGTDWVGAVRSLAKPGDVVACLGEQRIGASRRSLSQLLQSQLDLPLYILSGFYQEKALSPNWTSQAAVWGGSVAILIGFFLLQVKIQDLTQSWVQSVLFFMSILLEIGMIWVWNNLFE